MSFLQEVLNSDVIGIIGAYLIDDTTFVYMLYSEDIAKYKKSLKEFQYDHYLYKTIVYLAKEGRLQEFSKLLEYDRDAIDDSFEEAFSHGKGLILDYIYDLPYGPKTKTYSYIKASAKGDLSTLRQLKVQLPTMKRAIQEALRHSKKESIQEMLRIENLELLQTSILYDSSFFEFLNEWAIQEKGENIIEFLTKYSDKYSKEVTIRNNCFSEIWYKCDDQKKNILPIGETVTTTTKRIEIGFGTISLYNQMAMKVTYVITGSICSETLVIVW